jgi:hypothetical protein
VLDPLDVVVAEDGVVKELSAVGFDGIAELVRVLGKDKWLRSGSFEGWKANNFGFVLKWG